MREKRQKEKEKRAQFNQRLNTLPKRVRKKEPLSSERTLSHQNLVNLENDQLASIWLR